MTPEQIRRFVDAAYRAHEAKLRSYIRKRLNAQQQQTDDAMSMTFERLLKALERAAASHKYNSFLLLTAQMETPESQRTANLLRGVATYVIKDIFRKVSKEPLRVEPTADPEDDDDLIGPMDSVGLPINIFNHGLNETEANETYRQILAEVFRQTTRAFQQAVLIGMVYDLDDDAIAGRFGRKRIDVQRTRYLVLKRTEKIARQMSEV